MIRLKTLLEQAFLGASNAARFNLSKGSGGISGKTPNTELEDGLIDLRMPFDSKKETTSKDWVRETFEKAHAMRRKPNSTSYSIAKQLHEDIEGIGSGALLKTLNAIKNMDMLSSVIVSYIKLYKVSLYSDIESELSTSWDSIWLSIKRLNPNVLRFHDRGTNLKTI